jgi:hypothetical protein
MRVRFGEFYFVEGRNEIWFFIPFFLIGARQGLEEIGLKASLKTLRLENTPGRFER